jgi:hypothetical protein
MSIGGRDAPGLDTALLLPHWAGLTFQVDVKQRRAPGRRAGNVEPLPVHRPAHSAKTIPSLHDQVARRAASQWQQADPVLSGRELRGDLGAIGRKVPVILEAGMGRDPGNLTASALYGIEGRKDEVLLILSLLSHQAQGGRSPSAPVIEIAMGR